MRTSKKLKFGFAIAIALVAAVESSNQSNRPRGNEQNNHAVNQNPELADHSGYREFGVKFYSMPQNPTESDIKENARRI